jgi:hypothetical protein
MVDPMESDYGGGYYDRLGAGTAWKSGNDVNGRGSRRQWTCNFDVMRRAAATVISIKASGRCAARVDGAIRVIDATAWLARWKIGTLTPQTPASTSLSVTA